MNSGSYPKPVVVVPVHKANPTSFEVFSLRQCGQCLASRDILLVAPAGLDLGRYQEVLPFTGEVRVEPRWMESHQAYNRLMIAPIVYNALSGYSHVLIHEPDALVLRDELNYWCNQPFDYIGAPWFDGFSMPVPNAALIGVGNFGFSLHRLESTNRVMRSWRRWHSSAEQIGKDLLKGLLGQGARLKRAIRGTGIPGRLRGAWKLYDGPCDLFWSQVVPLVISDFRVAPATVALRFSWEVLPRRCFEICEGVLPFGIHAWAKYDLPFLMPLLKASGLELAFTNVATATTR